MTANNPFKLATKIQKRLKILIYGASGVGKTLSALTFPRPAIIDCEGGTDLYAGRDGMPVFSVLRAKSLTDVESAIKFIQADNGKTFETLIIDPITVLYDVQKDAAGKAAKKEDEMTPRDWNKVNKRMVNLYNALTDLPCHVVVIAHESDLYEGEGLNLKRVGTKADMDKKGVYIFDFIVRMRPDRSGEVVKSRGVLLGKTIPAVNWNEFSAAAGLFTEGTITPTIDDNAAAQRDSIAFSENVHWSQIEGAAPRLYAWALDKQKASSDDVNEAIARAMKSITDLTREEVITAITDYMDAKRQAAKEAN